MREGTTPLGQVVSGACRPRAWDTSPLETAPLIIRQRVQAQVGRDICRYGAERGERTSRAKSSSLVSA